MVGNSVIKICLGSNLLEYPRIVGHIFPKIPKIRIGYAQILTTKLGLGSY
ncbi:hypothetical protein Trichorick_01796 (plasmid) [Candidatus Trichorickettsia mobilis]|nr:hypothetical protein Trichorick_01796 [Candidatus Trichorickettsia mobilis]